MWCWSSERWVSGILQELADGCLVFGQQSCCYCVGFLQHVRLVFCKLCLFDVGTELFVCLLWPVLLLDDIVIWQSVMQPAVDRLLK